MVKSVLVFLFLIMMGAVVEAAYKPILNPITGQFDYVTVLYTCNGATGITFTDSNSCTWCATISTGGSVTTSLIQCPVIGDILMENGTYILQENGGKIAVE